MMKSLMISTLEKLINQAIASDLDHRLWMAPLEGKPISLVLEDWKMTLTLTPEQGRFRLSTDAQARAPTYLMGKTTDLFPLLFEKSIPAALMGSQLQLTGQMSVFEAYRTFFEKLDIDFEVQLSKKIGPSMARMFFAPIKAAKRVALKNVALAREEIPEWLQEEVNLLPSRLRVEDMARDLEVMRARVDRLEARISRLCKKING